MNSDTNWYMAPPMILPKEPSQIHAEGNNKTQLSVGGWMRSGAVRNWIGATGMCLFSYFSEFFFFFFTSCWILVKISMTNSSHLSHMWQAELECGPQDSHPLLYITYVIPSLWMWTESVNMITYSSSVFVAIGHMWLLNIEAWLMQLNK